MGLNRNINDDSTLAYLFNKTRRGASDAIEKAIESIKSLFVKKSGDTMTGTLTLNGAAVVEKNTAYAIGDAPGSQNAVSMSWTDKNNAVIGFLGAGWEADGKLFMQIGTQRTVSGTTKWHHVRQTIASDGTATVSFGQPAAWRAGLSLGSMATVNSPVPVANGGTGATTAANARTNLGAVNKAGDTMTGTLTSTPGSGVSYIAGARGDGAGLYVKKGSLNANQYIPALVIQTKAGGSWAIGNYNNESLPFVYATKANIDSQTNTVSQWAIDTSGNYSGKAANVTGTVAIANGGTGQTAVSTTTTLSSIATAGSNITISAARYSVWGKVATISIQLYDSATTPISSGATIATVVSGKRPATQISLQPAVVSTSSIALLSADLNTDGTVKLRGTSLSPSMGTVTFAGTYIVA